MSDPERLRDLLSSLDPLIRDLARGVLRDAKLEHMRHALWLIGDQELGAEPTPAIAAFVLETAKLDVVEKALLSAEFPIITIYEIARTDLDLLVAEVHERERVAAAAFGMPEPLLKDQWFPSPHIKPGTRVRVLPDTPGPIPAGTEFEVTECILESLSGGRGYYVMGATAGTDPVLTYDPGVWTKYVEVVL